MPMKNGTILHSDAAILWTQTPTSCPCFSLGTIRPSPASDRCPPMGNASGIAISKERMACCRASFTARPEASATSCCLRQKGLAPQAIQRPLDRPQDMRCQVLSCFSLQPCFLRSLGFFCLAIVRKLKRAVFCGCSGAMASTNLIDLMAKIIDNLFQCPIPRSL